MNQFETEYVRCRPAMFRAARRITNKETALLAVDEAVAKLWALSDKIDYINPHRVMGLFCTAARRAAIDAKKHSEFIKRDDKDWAITNLQHNKSERDVERTIAVHRALAMLSPLESWVAWNYFALEFSPKEIIEDLAKDGIVWTPGHFFRYIKHKVRPNLRTALLAVGADGML